MDIYNIDPFCYIVKEKDPQIEFEISTNPSSGIWKYLQFIRIPLRKRIVNPYGPGMVWVWTFFVTNTYFLPPNRRVWIRGRIGDLLCRIGGERGCLPVIQRTFSCTEMTFTFTRGDISYRCLVPPAPGASNERARAHNPMTVPPRRIVGNSCTGYYMI